MKIMFIFLKVQYWKPYSFGVSTESQIATSIETQTQQDNLSQTSFKSSETNRK